MLCGKPFIMLFPLSIITSKCSYDNIKKCTIDVIVMNPPPTFLNEDADRKVADCAWFIVNLTEGGRISVERLPNI